MCFTVQLSKIGFALLFVSNSFAIISCRFLPVKNFFISFLQLFVRHNSLILSRVFSDVKNFFHFFPSTQKEGFEPSHGANRLYP